MPRLWCYIFSLLDNNEARVLEEMMIATIQHGGGWGSEGTGRASEVAARAVFWPFSGREKYKLAKGNNASSILKHLSKVFWWLYVTAMQNCHFPLMRQFALIALLQESKTNRWIDRQTDGSADGLADRRVSKQTGWQTDLFNDSLLLPLGWSERGSVPLRGRCPISSVLLSVRKRI